MTELNKSLESHVAKIPNFSNQNLIIDLNLLKDIKKRYKLYFYVVSLRSNKENAFKQVKSFDFYNEFEEFIFLEHSQSNPKNKVLNDLNNNNEVLFFVGDSSTDYDAAIINNIKFIHVQTGWGGGNVNYETHLDINTALKKIFHE